jgi:PAS domain S-box
VLEREPSRGISNSIPGAVFEFRAGPDGERSVDFIGEEAKSLLGLLPERPDFFDQFAGRVPQGHREEFLQSVEEAVRERERWQQEILYEHPDEGQVWLLGSAEPEAKGEQVLYRGTLLDITDRKRAEQRFRKEQDRLKTLFNNLPTPVVRCEAREEAAPIMGTNPAFEEIFGISQEEAEGTDINELLVPTGQKEAAAEIDKRVLSNGSAEMEVQRIAGDGLRDFQLQVGGHKPLSSTLDWPSFYKV